jgi:hypothetical protein
MIESLLDWRDEKVKEIEKVTGWKFDNSIEYDDECMSLNFLNGKWLVTLDYENKVLIDVSKEKIA